jgi:thiol-disulfide isomerase/thioredoxin
VLPAFLFFFFASLVDDVRGLIARNDLAGAEALARSHKARAGANSEVAAAVSWLGRAALAAKQYDKAESFATEAFQIAQPLLRTRKLDADPWLPTAVGASIEVRSQVMAARGGRSEAVAFLRDELARYRATSIAERISKNINLISLEGKPAPALQVTEYAGPKPRPLSALRGRPVLLFFWAHWCGDCKQLGSVIAAMQKTYGPKGLEVLMPTRLYGYVAGGEDAAPATERPYIERIRKEFYAPLAQVPAPLSSANFVTYGASTTPTIVLVDAAGIVRYYHPGAPSESELSARIQKLLAK